VWNLYKEIDEAVGRCQLTPDEADEFIAAAEWIESLDEIDAA